MGNTFVPSLKGAIKANWSKGEGDTSWPGQARPKTALLIQLVG